jgi:hypothetical protein
MAMLIDIVDGELGDRTKIGWLLAKDSDGKLSRYEKGNPAPEGATAHIHVHLNGKLEILLASDAKSILRQNVGGLPAIAVVRFQLKATEWAGFGDPVLAHWPNFQLYEYKQDPGKQGGFK